MLLFYHIRLIREAEEANERIKATRETSEIKSIVGTFPRYDEVLFMIFADI